MNREHFIPFSKRELSSRLTTNFTDKTEKDDFAHFCGIIGSVYHFQFHSILEDFKTAYASIDPDRNPLTLSLPSEPEILQFENDALSSLNSILIAGNYSQITPDQLQVAFGKASPWGLNLKVDTEAYEVLSLYYRGEHPDQLDKKKFFINKYYDFSVYDRVVLVFKLKETTDDNPNTMHQFVKGKVYLKLFKNVPAVDLEMLFPDTKIVIRSFDKVKVIAPLAAGIMTTAYKILGYIMKEGNPVHLWTQIGFWVLIGSLFGVALKGFLGYKNTVQKYLKTLTTSLYFQNLDNNSGVFKHILDEAEEEECKELILAYYFLLVQRTKITSIEKLDECVEDFFRTEYGFEIDFEVDDAIRKLTEMGLLSDEKSLTVVPLRNALTKLNSMWDDFVNA